MGEPRRDLLLVDEVERWIVHIKAMLRRCINDVCKNRKFVVDAPVTLSWIWTWRCRQNAAVPRAQAKMRKMKMFHSFLAQPVAHCLQTTKRGRWRGDGLAAHVCLRSSRCDVWCGAGWCAVWRGAQLAPWLRLALALACFLLPALPFIHFRLRPDFRG